MREIVFDTETTGLDPQQGDRVVEIGCVELVDRCETGNVYHAYFNPGMAMPSIAEQVHGLSDAFLADKPWFEDQVEDLLDFLGDAPLIAHNANFDFSFVNHELGLCGRLHLPMSRMICTAAMSRNRHPGAKHSLDALCTRYGIDRSHRTLHGALLDAQLLTQVYIELTGGRQIGLDMAAPVVVETVTHAVVQPLNRTPRYAVVTTAELERHASFVARLDDPIWAWGEASGSGVDPVVRAA